MNQNHEGVIQAVPKAAGQLDTTTITVQAQFTLHELEHILELCSTDVKTIDYLGQVINNMEGALEFRKMIDLQLSHKLKQITADVRRQHQEKQAREAAEARKVVEGLEAGARKAAELGAPAAPNAQLGTALPPGPSPILPFPSADAPEEIIPEEDRGDQRS